MLVALLLYLTAGITVVQSNPVAVVGVGVAIVGLGIAVEQLVRSADNCASLSTILVDAIGNSCPNYRLVHVTGVNGTYADRNSDFILGAYAGWNECVCQNGINVFVKSQTKNYLLLKKDNKYGETDKIYGVSMEIDWNKANTKAVPGDIIGFGSINVKVHQDLGDPVRKSSCYGDTICCSQGCYKVWAYDDINLECSGRNRCQSTGYITSSLASDGAIVIT